MSRSVAGHRFGRQMAVARWVIRTFGTKVFYDKRERALRVLEEAVELAQASGVTLTDVTNVACFVYEKPVGEIPQEIAGVAITLLGYCASQGYEVDREEEQELHRIINLDRGKVREKHQLKIDQGIGVAFD